MPSLPPCWNFVMVIFAVHVQCCRCNFDPWYQYSLTSISSRSPQWRLMLELFFFPLAATIMIDCCVWFIKRYMSVYLAVMVVVPWHASHRNGTIDLIFLQLWERTKSIIFYIFLAIHALGSVRLHRRLDWRMCHGRRSNGQHNLLQRFRIIDIIFVRW